MMALTWQCTDLAGDACQKPARGLHLFFLGMQAQHYAAVAGLPLLPAGSQVLLAWASLHNVK